MMMKRPFGWHYLSCMGPAKTGDGHALRSQVKLARDNGAEIFELACDPINDMSAMETAAALNDAGMKYASYCRFFPDKWCGDPLAEDNAQALAVIRKDLGFIDVLASQGIVVPFMTGPSCFVLEKVYDLPKVMLLDRAYEWYRKVGDLIGDRKLTVCIEYLRPSEDRSVLGSMAVVCQLVDRLADPRIQIHGDIFHMLERNENPHDMLMMAGKRLAYLHAHGTKRQPPGWYDAQNRFNTDWVDWNLVAQALNRIDYEGPIVPEPFGEEIRKAIPALGQGLPPAMPAPQYYEFAKRHLLKNGIIFR
jgi:sugar phosphate isomerase/epimerase